jgi:hypothetical protein
MATMATNSDQLNKIQEYLNIFNPYVKIYKQAVLLLREHLSIAPNMIIKSNKSKNKTLDAPTASTYNLKHMKQ